LARLGAKSDETAHAPGERQVLGGAQVYFLPDKIEIKDGAPGTEPTTLTVADARPARSIEHRVTVRGHWRRPPAQASDQRLRWVRPHFRGPREAVQVEREYRLE
jgi:hypothetical protein